MTPEVPGSSAIAERARIVERLVGDVLVAAAGLGFLGTMPMSGQIEHSLGYAWVLEAELGGAPVSVLDLGSGGGLPGLVLIACWPESHFTLLEANERRSRFLEDAVSALGAAGRAQVACGRAESLARQPVLREHFAAVTARSFGRPAVTAECAAPFLAVGGRLVSEPPPSPNEGEPPGSGGDRWPAQKLEELGLAPGQVVRIGGFGYQVLSKVIGSKERYPRGVSVPTRRPLF